MARIASILCIALYVQACTVQDWRIEDWDLQYKNCEIEADRDEWEIECEWKV